MRKLFLFLFLSLICISIYTQNYQSVNSGRLSYYTDHYNYIHSIKVDSANYTEDSVLYLMPNIRQVSEDCVDILSPSWHGDRVIIKDNGDNLFFNKNNDTITIKTSALLDEDWQAYVLEDSLIVYAAVYNVDTLTFLGINDSVKYLSFNVFDENMIDIEHPLESKQLILSKNYGLVETVSFYHFPYSNTISDYHTYDIAFDQMVIIGMNKPDLGVTNLTKREVFDFQPGDELHITYENSFCTYSNIQDIIYIYLERNDSGDSIYYDVKRTMFQQIFNGEDYNTYFIDDTIQEIIAIDTSFNKLPDQAVSDGSIAYTNFMVNAARPLKSYNLQYAGLIVGESDCWELIFWDGCESTGDYFKGLGGPYYQCTYGTEVKKRRLQYYNIGDDEWGNPIIFTKLENGDASSNINIFPNPVKDDIISIFINNSFDFATCSVYNINGKQVYFGKIVNKNSRVSFKELPTGVYILRLNLDGEISNHKLIKQ